VSRLLMLNFNTFEETGAFKQRLLGDGFVGTDAMDEDKPGPLARPGGIWAVKAPTKFYSFRRLYRRTWEGELSPGRAYSAEFETWMKKVLARTIDCVYLSGHHRRLMMWWVDDYPKHKFFYMSMENVWRLEFGVIDWPNQKRRSKVIKLSAARLRDGCMLVVGSGCNVCNYSIHYQSFFKNVARKPLVLGWDTTMWIPRIEDGEDSVNGRFFDYLAAYAKSNAKVPKSDKLKWFYENEPMELVRAWGHGVLTYKDKGQKRLWTNARARNVDGQLYGFEDQDGKAEPVRVRP
jgi:hypothetical protein